MAVLLLAGLFARPLLTVVGAALGAAIMLGAVVTHLRIGDPLRLTLPAATYGAMSTGFLVAASIS